MLKLQLLIVSCFLSSWLYGQATCGLKINEVMFNPPTAGFDFVELVNHTNEGLNLSHYLIANRDARGKISSVKRISRESLILPPGNYLVLTADSAWLRSYYYIPNTAIVCELSSLPSYNDKEGTVVVLHDYDSTICDELFYQDKWHFSLIDDPTGVSLERVSLEDATQNQYNWASASSSSGYGTPGRRNSQHRSSEIESDILTVQPKVFSPDNDGLDDFVQLTIKLAAPGFVANATIFDVVGRRAKYLLKNVPLGTTNLFRWDGQDDKNKALPPGPYILMTDIFNLEGHTRKFKNVVIIGKRNQ
jgi:hypothetical protein